jgi:hypothetical protein
MWLLDVEDQRLHEFHGEKIPPYAIYLILGVTRKSALPASRNCRTEDELWFEERKRDEKWHTASMRYGGTGKHIEFDSLAGFWSPNFEAEMVEARKPAGMDKIRKPCERAKADGHEYVWVDTCCIDKSSRAQLQEAINSMWNYYKNSIVCYAYLQDVEASSFEGSIASSRWFTRGRTLQELIAPKNVVVVDRNFGTIGTKESLRSVIFDITGIHEAVLKGQDPTELSITQRMSWAAERRTTRVEDLAYCLHGIFNVQLPMLYGEGENAVCGFKRKSLRSARTSQFLPGSTSLSAWTTWPRSSPQAPRTLLTQATLSRRSRRRIGCLTPRRTTATATTAGKPPLYSLANSGLNIQLAIADFHTGDELEPLAGCDSDQPYPKYNGKNEHLYVGITSTAFPAQSGYSCSRRRIRNASCDTTGWHVYPSSV